MRLWKERYGYWRNNKLGATMAKQFYAKIQGQMRIAIPPLIQEFEKLKEGDRVVLTIEKVKGA